MFARMARLSRWLDVFLIRRVGGCFAVCNVVLIGAIILQVALRRGLGGGFVVLEELQWHLYAGAMMFGISYAQTRDIHVRVDVLARRFSKRTRSAIEIGGILFLIMPFVLIVFLQSLDFVYDSWRVGERSDSPVGLPARWVIKSVIPASFGLLFLALFSRLLREAASLGGVGVGGGDDAPKTTLAFFAPPEKNEEEKNRR
jgi:TRAP-type mannitol/chloroaromatic compound transport system permease small subunit